MSPSEMALLFAALWVSLVLIARWVVVPMLRNGPDREPVKGLLWYGCRLYCFLVHRARYRGLADLRDRIDPGGMVIVSNHTSAIDPVLIQCGCRFKIRWLMARDMMTPVLDWLWKIQDIIPVSRDGSDSAPVREAIRHVRRGGAIGIFPEARIVKPRGEIRPFLAGVGAIVARTGAPVLLVWITDTPDVPTMGRTFYTPSRSLVQYIDLIHFGDGTDPIEITEQLRRRLSEVSGWPLNDEPMPPWSSELAEAASATPIHGSANQPASQPANHMA